MPRWSYELFVTNRAFRLSVEGVLAASPGRADRMVVADSLDPGRSVDILFVDLEPRACRAGLAVATAGQARAVLAVSEFKSLPVVIAALTGGMRVTGGAVSELGMTLASIADRDVAILRAIASGASTEEIASSLGVSRSSAKREFVRLQALVGVEGRRSLQDFCQPFLLNGIRFGPE